MHNWNHTANSIFLDAIDITDPIQRKLFVETACEARGHIKVEVLELLKAHEESTGFLEDPTENESITASDASNPGLEYTSGPRSATIQCIPPGSMLGRYRLDRVLGNGAMGIVYLATDTRLGRPVAIKIPRTELLRDAEKRIEREARTMASVKHRNLASILDVDQCDGVTFLVMEYISGTSLSDMLRDCNRISSVEAAQIMWKLAEATDCAHTSGVVHRDIKPGNIIIDECNEPILMDFGLAYSDSEDSRMTKFGAILGTPAYMAPEQLHGASHLVGPHSDIYALGAILYELLTGSTVYPGSTSQVLDALANGETAVPPSQVQPNIDPWLEAICTKAIAHQPSQRFQSARELADAFQCYLSDDKVQLQLLVGQRKPTEEPMHYRRLIAAVIVGAMIVGGVYFLKSRKQTSLTTSPPIASAEESTHNLGLNWSEPERVKFVSGVVPATNASINGDGLRIVFMMRTEDGLVLCESTRNDRSDPFSAPRPLLDLVLENDQTLVGKRHGNPWLSHDGLDMILYCIQPGLGADLFHTHRDALDSPWAPLRSLGSEINSHIAEYAASMTPDKLTVFWFRPNSTNSYDGEIWTASRSSTSDDFSSARLLGSGINTLASEQHPCISENGLLLTFDRGTPEPRLWQARRDSTTEDFGDAYPVIFLGELNEKNAYGPSLTSDCELMIFTSNVVPGKEGFETGELWQSRRVP